MDSSNADIQAKNGIKLGRSNSTQPKKRRRNDSSSGNKTKQMRCDSTSKTKRYEKENGKVENIPIEPSLKEVAGSSLPTNSSNYIPLGNLYFGAEPVSVRQDRINENANSVFIEFSLASLQTSIDAMKDIGGVPYSFLQSILEEATPDQLYTIECRNPYLVADSDDLWQRHCRRDFRSYQREKTESWRHLYLRCQRATKLKILNANIKKVQESLPPPGTVKMAYMDGVVKPPKEVVKMQAKYGTGSFAKERQLAPFSQLPHLGTPYGQGGVVGQGAKAVQGPRGRPAAAKSRKAPLMAKALVMYKTK